MAKYIIEDTTLIAIADAIRAKTGSSESILVTDMAERILNIAAADDVILAEQSVSTTYNNQFLMHTGFVDAPNPIVAGEANVIVWDGTEYECTAISLAGTSFESMGGVAVIGNTDMIAGGDNGVPFVIVYFASETSFKFMITAVYDTEAATHTVAIYRDSRGGGFSDDVRYVTFMSEDGTTELYKKPVATGDDCVDVVAKGLIDTPTKESTNTEVFTYSGWSLTSGGEANDSALLNVTEDRTVYVSYTVSTRYYTVRFFDGEETQPMKTVQVQYGETANYLPKKDGFSFDGWQPSNENITHNTDCYAQWSELIEPVYVELLRGSLEGHYSNDTATQIGEYGMANYPNLTSIVFANVTKVDQNAFIGSKNITRMDFHNKVAFSVDCLNGITALDTLILRSGEMCTGFARPYNTKIASGTGYIYVPSVLVNSYKSSVYWSTYADQFRAIEDYPDICG